MNQDELKSIITKISDEIYSKNYKALQLKLDTINDDTPYKDTVGFYAFVDYIRNNTCKVIVKTLLELEII